MMAIIIFSLLTMPWKFLTIPVCSVPRTWMNYFASAGYLQDGGIVDNSELKRYTARTTMLFLLGSFVLWLCLLKRVWSLLVRVRSLLVLGSWSYFFLLSVMLVEMWLASPRGLAWK